MSEQNTAIENIEQSPSDVPLWMRMRFDFKIGPIRGCDFHIWRDGADVKITTTGPEGGTGYAIPYEVFAALLAGVGGGIEDAARESWEEDNRGEPYASLDEAAAEAMVPPLHAAMTWPQWCEELLDTGHGEDDHSPSFSAGSTLIFGLGDVPAALLPPTPVEGDFS